MKNWLFCLWCLPVVAVAQATMPTEFPADATEPTAEALQARLLGKDFAVQPFSGPGWRLQFNSSGYAFLDVDTGARDKGTWRVEGDKLCVNWQRVTSGCSQIRLRGDAVYLKRASGEVVLMSAR